METSRRWRENSAECTRSAAATPEVNPAAAFGELVVAGCSSLRGEQQPAIRTAVGTLGWRMTHTDSNNDIPFRCTKCSRTGHTSCWDRLLPPHGSRSSPSLQC